MTVVTWETSPLDDNAFRQEQDKPGRIWTFLGLTSDLQNDNDWFRATLGGRSVFVQKAGSEIVGFESVCPHRFYPLRTTDRGNGPIVCGFHHWHYDGQGRVVGIPMCKELFGVSPREMQARLMPIEIALYGSLVFGRFGDASPSESLEHFLGDGWPILAAVSTLPSRLHPFERTVEANWRLMMSITLDEYHAVAVHKVPNYFKTSNLKYWRFGLHSALFADGDDTLPSMAEDCRTHRHRPMGYKIFNIFPNLAVTIFNARAYWYAHIQQFVPVSARQSKWRGWFFPTNFPAAGETRLQRLFRPFSEPIRARIVRHHIEKIGNEDHVTCERLQEVFAQAGRQPILGSQEARVGWFREAYTQATRR